MSIDVYERFPQAVVDQPIGGKFTFTVFDEDAGLDIRRIPGSSGLWSILRDSSRGSPGRGVQRPRWPQLTRRAQYLADSGQRARCAAR